MHTNLIYRLVNAPDREAMEIADKLSAGVEDSGLRLALFSLKRYIKVRKAYLSRYAN